MKDNNAAKIQLWWLTNASIGDRLLIVPKTHRSKETEREEANNERNEKERAGEAQKTGNER